MFKVITAAFALSLLHNCLCDSEPQREEILFEKVDKNLDGYLTNAELDAVFLLFDTNGDHTITKAEFDKDWTSLYHIGTQAEANVLFNHADINDDHIINKQDLPGIFHYFDVNNRNCPGHLLLGEELQVSCEQVLLSNCDLRVRDNSVSIDEFLTQWGSLTLTANGHGATTTIDTVTV